MFSFKTLSLSPLQFSITAMVVPSCLVGGGGGVSETGERSENTSKIYDRN